MSDFWNSVGNFFNNDTTQSVLHFGSGLMDLYGGLTNQINSSSLYGDASDLLRQQSSLASLDYNRYKELFGPIEEAQAKYALEDLNILRPLNVAQRNYEITSGLRDINRQQNVYQPLEESVVSKLADGVDIDEMMNEATSDVKNAYARNQASTNRAALLSGVNTSSGSYQRGMAGQGANQALAEATARTQARRVGEDLDLSRKSQALNYAAGIPLTNIPTYNAGSSLQSSMAGYGSSGLGMANLAGQLSNEAQNQFAGMQSMFSTAFGGNK